MKKYVVWVGRTPGIYDTWADCQAQTHQFAGAKFKSFEDEQQAKRAYAKPYTDSLGENSQPGAKSNPSKKTKQPTMTQVVKTGHIMTAYGAVYKGGEFERVIAVDAGCSGNPGKVYYRGVSMPDGKEIFSVSGLYGTNNIGEFLAMEHGLKWMSENGFSGTVYYDSKIAHSWVQRGHASRHAELDSVAHGLTDAAEEWLQKNGIPPTVKLEHWNTKEWGEIPADFGLK